MRIKLQGVLEKIDHVSGKASKKSGQPYDFYKPVINLGEGSLSVGFPRDFDHTPLAAFVGKEALLILDLVPRSGTTDPVLNLVSVE